MDSQRKPSARPPSGLSTEQLNARALAKGRRAAMLRRARRIRRAVVGLVAALFSAAFLAVYVQLASGHDPALSTRQNATPATVVQSSTSSSSPSSSGEEASGTSASGSESSSSG